jgi:hypothetical protein
MAAAIGVPAVLAAASLMLAGWGLWDAHAAARGYYDLAVRIGVKDPVGAAAYALREVPHAAIRVFGMSLGVVALLVAHRAQATAARQAQRGLFVLAAADLVVMAWALNPMIDAALVRGPSWAPIVAAHPGTRFYMGGRSLYGTFNESDPDAAKSFVRPFGLTPAEGRSVVAAESVFYPSAWRMRELFSYDLAELWPRPLLMAHARFLRATRDERDRFLDRAAVRFRIVQPPAARGREPLAQLDYFKTLCLYDWGPGPTRAFVVSQQAVVANTEAQIERLFAPGDDARFAVVTAVAAAPAVGVPGTPGPSAARIVAESANRVLVEATAGPTGGFLVLLDTFSPDWTATVDGQPAVIYRGNALFRTVPIVPGPHRVEFLYRPWGFQVGGAISLAGALGVLRLLRRPRKKGRRR